MVFINIEDRGTEKQDSNLIKRHEFDFERDDQTFIENVDEYCTNPRSMDEMLTSILKDLEFAEVSLHSTSHLLEPTDDNSESNSKSQEITEIIHLPTIANLNSVPLEIKDIEVGEPTFKFKNFNEKDVTFHEEEFLPVQQENFQLHLEQKEENLEFPGNFEKESNPSKDFPLCLEPKEKSFVSPKHFEETNPSKDLQLCLESKKNFESPKNFEEETGSSEENNANISILQVNNENDSKDKPKDSEEMEHQTAANKPEEKVMFKIPLLSSNPYINFVQDFQAKYKGDEVTPSMVATLASAKWRKMGTEEKQIYKNINKNHCEKNQQIKKLKELVKTLNASEETIFAH